MCNDSFYRNMNMLYLEAPIMEEGKKALSILGAFILSIGIH